MNLFITLKFQIIYSSRGTILISSRIPGYDLSTIRVFAISVLLSLVYSLQAIYCHCGYILFITPVSAALSNYLIFYSFANVMHDFYQYFFGIGANLVDNKQRRWKLKFPAPSTFYDIFIGALITFPTKEEIEASAAPFNAIQLVLSTFLAVLSLASLIAYDPQVHIKLSTDIPVFVQFSTVICLIVTFVVKTGAFDGTLVLRNRISALTGFYIQMCAITITILYTYSYSFRYGFERTNHDISYYLYHTYFGVNAI